MKLFKPIVFLLFTYLLAPCLIAQTGYRVDLDLRLLSKRYHMECDTRAEITFTYTDMTTYKLTYQVDREYNDGTSFYKSGYFTTSKTIKTIQCIGIHRDNPGWLLGGCQGRGSGTASVSVYDSDFPCPNKELNGFLGNYDAGSYLQVRITPNNLSISYNALGLPQDKTTSGDDGILTSSKKIRITAPSGYPSAVYKWQYLLPGGGWADFSYAYQGNNPIEFCGDDLTSAFQDLVGRGSVQIRINNGCSASNILLLTPLICGPEIVSAEGIDLACADDYNGKIKLLLSRPLMNGEYLNFQVNDQSSSDPFGDRISWSDPRVEKSSDGKEITISGFGVGAYRVRIIGYYKDDTSVVYTDESDAFTSGVITIQAPQPVEFNGSIVKTNVSCPGGNDGTITVGAKGGSGTYIVKILENGELIAESSPFQGTGVVEGLYEGDYDVHLFDSNGCEAKTFEIAFIEGPYYTYEIETVEWEIASLDENMQEENNGSIRITVSPGLAPYQYTWHAGDPTGTVLSETENATNHVSELSGVNSGTYYVEVTNKHGCSIGQIIELPRAPEIRVSVIQTGTIVCSGDHTGELEATVTGGDPPFTYQWYSINEYTGQRTPVGSDDPVLSNIYAGPYQLLVTDNNGSKARSSIVYQTEENPITVVFTTDRLDCIGDANGFLEINVSGGTPPYSYVWFNGTTGTRVENLSSGNYPVKITDNAGCFKEAIGIVRQPDPFVVNSVIEHPACNGLSNGKIRLQISGGNVPYTIEWSDGSNQTTLENLPAGNYWVKVTDGKNCGSPIYKEFTLIEPDPLTINSVSYQPVSAFGRSDGMFSIRINGGKTPYSITCRKNGSTVITPKSVEYQSDGSALVVYANLVVGDYVVSVVQSAAFSGCNATFQITVAEPPPLSVSIRESHPITCFEGRDGSLLAEGIGGEPDSPTPYFYEWFRVEGYTLIPIQSGVHTISNLAEGNYVVKITDKNGVTATSPEYRLRHPALLMLEMSADPVSCAGGSDGRASAAVTGGAGGYTYLWDSGETTSFISGKRNGEFSVVVTDRRGCTIGGRVTITSPAPFVINYTLHPITCYGFDNGAVFLDLQGGEAPYTYKWSNDSEDPFVENLKPGEYSVQITDNSGCSIDTAFVIPELLPINVELVELKQPIGFGYSDGSIRVEITGGNTPYDKALWTDEKGNPLHSTLTYEGDKAFSELNGIPEGNYFLRIEDANYSYSDEWEMDPCGCLDSASFYMPQPPKLIVRIEKIASVKCFGGNDGAIISESEGGVPFPTGLPYTFDWYLDGAFYLSGTVDLSELKAGNYQLKITDANGIEAWSETVAIDQPEAITLQFQSADIKCSRDANGWAEVSVSGGTPPYSYEWSTGDITARVDTIPRGKYMVWVTDANQCEATGVVQIIQANAIQINAELIQPTCFQGSDGEIRISLSKGEPPYSYYWENNQQTLNYTGLSKGTYTFTVTDAHGCGYETETYELGEPEKITVDLGENRELCKGQTLTIQAKIPEPALSFTWYDSSQKELFSGEEYTLSAAGVYTVKAITAKGCSVYGDVTITRDDREISADFIVASQVPIHDEVFFVNIATPAPESVEWILPESGDFEVITQNQQVLSVIFHDYGTYTFAMRSHSGKCWETVYKSVRVMDKIDIDNYEDADEPMLKSFTVSPNPASQRFWVNIELREDSPVDLYLIDSGTGTVSAHKRLTGNKIYRELFELPASRQGTYVVSLVAPKAKAVQKIILH
jgi:hypothetical protein